MAAHKLRGCSGVRTESTVGYSRALVENLVFTSTPWELSAFWLLELISYAVLGVVLARFCRLEAGK